MKIANLSDSETARNSYDKDVEDAPQKPVSLMKITSLSDSETARSVMINTYTMTSKSNSQHYF